jgi:hypothetical protein
VFPAVAIALAGLSLGRMQNVCAADLTQYISPDFCAVLVIHPDRIGESTLAEAVKSALPKQMTGDPLAAIVANMKKQKDLPKGMDVDKLAGLLKDKTLHRVVVMIDSNLEQNAPRLAIIAQFNNDIDGEGIISALGTDWQPGEANGVKYRKHKGKPGEPDGAALAPDNRMLILGAESAVAKMLANNESERPLLKQLQKASLKHDILLEVYAEPLWAGLTKSTGKSIDQLLAPSNNPAMANIAKDLKSVSLQLDFSGKTLLHGEVVSGKPDTATALAGMGQMGLTGAKQQYAAMKQPPPGAQPNPAGAILGMMPAVSKLGDEVLAGLSIKAEGTQMTVDLPTPDSLPEAIKSAAKMAPMFMPGAAPAAGP